MRTWVRCKAKLPCGSCSSMIPTGGAMLVVEANGTRRVRCAACAKRVFGESVPTEFPEDATPVLAMMTPRQPDFVTAGNLARGVRAKDFKVRQSGEREPGQEG